MLVADYQYYPLNFKRPSGTSRGILTKKDAWIVRVWDDSNSEVKGLGECSIIRGLSPDDRNGYEDKLREVCKNINQIETYFENDLIEWPSIYFGFEMALQDLANGGKDCCFLLSFPKMKLKYP